MQLLNSVLNSPKASSSSLLETLEDIANNIQIQSNFCIRHPDYKPLELPQEAIARFQHLPIELQHKYLSLQLQSFLYGIYYNGSLHHALALEKAEAPSKLNLENNTFLGIDIEFYDRLHQSNCGKGYFDPGWRVLRQEADDSLAVSKGGIVLHVNREQYLAETQNSPAIGDVIAVRMPRNLMQNGFYVAIGNAESEGRYQSVAHPITVRIYFHFTAEGALAVMSDLTRALNESNISFHFKVLYNPAEYHRYDSGVLYFEQSDYAKVRNVLQQVYTQNRKHFQPQVPLFTKPLAPGLALAEEPNQKFADRESFGMNRCQIVANGLLQAWSKQDNSPRQRLTSILESFASLGIDLERPYLNPGAQDEYSSLNL